MAETLTTGLDVKSAAEEMKRNMDARGGLQNVYVAASGGSLTNLYPIYYLLRSESSALGAASINAAEFVAAPPAAMGENSLVITLSQSGSTPETVAAAKCAKERGATVIGFTAKPNAPLGELCDYNWIYSCAVELTEQPDFALSAMGLGLRFGFELLRLYDGYAHYEKAEAAFAVLNRSLNKIVEKVQPRALAFAEAHKGDEVVYTLGSGPCAEVAYAMSICILIEMEWIHSSSIHSGELFHGPFEITGKDVPFLMFMTEGRARYMDERALAFIKKYSDRVSIIDIRELGVSIIAPEIEEYFSGLYAWTVAFEYGKALGEAKNHPLRNQRYMGKEAY